MAVARAGDHTGARATPGNPGALHDAVVCFVIAVVAAVRVGHLQIIFASVLAVACMPTGLSQRARERSLPPPPQPNPLYESPS